MLLCVHAACPQLGPSSADVVWNHEDEQSAALPALVEGDLAHVSQIIQNLVTNAIKARDATPALMAMVCAAEDLNRLPPHLNRPPPDLKRPPPVQFGVGRQVKVNVHLDASLDVDQPLERVLRVDVIDQGVGIKEEDLERIFDPYVQLAPVNGGGTGLGLHSACCIAFHTLLTFFPVSFHVPHSRPIVYVLTPEGLLADAVVANIPPYRSHSSQSRAPWAVASAWRAPSGWARRSR